MMLEKVFLKQWFIFYCNFSIIRKHFFLKRNHVTTNWNLYNSKISFLLPSKSHHKRALLKGKHFHFSLQFLMSAQIFPLRVQHSKQQQQQYLWTCAAFPYSFSGFIFFEGRLRHKNAGGPHRGVRCLHFQEAGNFLIMFPRHLPEKRTPVLFREEWVSFLCATFWDAEIPSQSKKNGTKKTISLTWQPPSLEGGEFSGGIP